MVKLGIDHDKAYIIFQRSDIPEFTGDAAVYKDGIMGVDPAQFTLGVFSALVELVKLQALFNPRITHVKWSVVVKGEDIETEPMDILPRDPFVGDDGDQFDDFLITGRPQDLEFEIKLQLRILLAGYSKAVQGPDTSQD